MAGGKKRKKSDRHRQIVSKKIKSGFEKLVQSVDSDKASSEVNPRTRRAQNVFENWLDEARNRENDPPKNVDLEKPERGVEKSHVSELKNQNDFVKISTDSTGGIDFVIRRGAEIVAPNLFMRETNYAVTVRVSPELENVTLASFIAALWDVFDALFTDCLRKSENEEICFHVTHRELEGSLSTSVYELKEENRGKVIFEIMSRLTGWNQSANPSAAVKHLGISATIIKRNLPGDGVLLAIGDENLRKKSFSRQNFNGSIFYVDCEKNCFFISIYFGMLYNNYLTLFDSAPSSSIKKRANDEMYNLFSRKGEELEKDAAKFFKEIYDLDIEMFESGSDCFLRELVERSNCQFSIFSDSESYKRVLMIPETYNPLMEHVNILMTQYLKKTEPRKTVRCLPEIVQHHYHGIRINCRGFVGQNQSYCVFCGVYFSYTRPFHGCTKNEILCDVCHRPRMEWQMFKQVAPTEQINFCANVPASLTKDCSLDCTICKKKGSSALCLEIHRRLKCRDRIRCKNCCRVINLVGKYSSAFNKDPVVCHESCEEVFCTLCNDYVEGFDDLKKPSHVCYVPAITKAKKWPSLIVSFDFETYPCDEDGTMKPNMVHMIYQAGKNDCSEDFRAVFFTDVPMEGVSLNGETVVPGKEYTPDLSSDLKNYYCFETLHSELAPNDPQLVENMSSKKMTKLSDHERLIDNHPNDPELCHFLRNPEIGDLTVHCAVKSHLDIFQFQLNTIENIQDDEEYDDDDDDENGEKVTDWRRELKKLKKIDKDFVDKARFAQNDLTEVEAVEEEKAYRQKMKNKVAKKLPTCNFIIREAGEDKEDEDDDKDSAEAETNNTSRTKESLYFKQSVFYPSEVGGDVPENRERESCDQIDFHVKEMAKLENVRKLQELCENPFPDCINIVKVEERQPTLKKFCSHETESNLLSRIKTYKQSLTLEKSNCLKQFCLYILQPKFENAVFLGMYSSGFDNHFVFMQMIELGVRVNPVFKGNKLLTFSIAALNIRFLDFFCYVPSSLKNLEKSFNLKTGSKGYFPHLLNHPENYGLEIPHLPPKFYYEPEMMKNEDLKDFEKWYDQNYHQKFVFRQELLSYCELDVKILMAASLTFVKETLEQQTEFVDKVRKLKSNGQKIWMKNKAGEKKSIVPNLVHVFSTGLCTLSSYVNTVFRSFYLEEKTLPMITHDVEENYSTRCSKLEMEVLTFIREVEKVKDLEFGDRFRGQRRFTVVCPQTQKTHTFYVDGYSPSQKTVYEVLGCVFHGCFDCFRPDDKLKQGIENCEAVRLTNRRLDLLKLHIDVEAVRIIKECEWKKKTQTDLQVVEFLKTSQVETLGGRRMSVKETFRGGLVSKFDLLTYSLGWEWKKMFVFFCFDINS